MKFCVVFFMSRSFGRLNQQRFWFKRSQGQDHGLKSHPTDWWNQGSNLGNPGYRVSHLSTTSRQLVKGHKHA